MPGSSGPPNTTRVVGCPSTPRSVGLRLVVASGVVGALLVHQARYSALPSKRGRRASMPPPSRPPHSGQSPQSPGEPQSTGPLAGLTKWPIISGAGNSFGGPGMGMGPDLAGPPAGDFIVPAASV